MNVQSWIKFVAPEDIVEGVSYFIAKHKNIGDPYHENVMLLGRGLNLKLQWTCKPGIAIHAAGGDKLREYLARDPSFKAVAIPADWSTRWKARRRR